MVTFIFSSCIPNPWTKFNQEELDAVRNAPIKLSVTVYRWFKDQKKRDGQMSIREDVC
jgi:hypothetical protein